MKIAYQGIKGAYSEAAIYSYFKNPETMGFETFEEVFEAVKKGISDYGFIPVENTIAGSVSVNYDLLLKEDVYVIAEVFYRIRHCLLSHKNSELSDIKKAYSHPHALEQCRDFLKKHNIKPIPEYDTAGAAKIVSERKINGEAAVASELCSKIYGLKIIEKGIESNKENTTKFFVIVKKENIPNNLKKEKTSIAFKTKHYPGALVNALQRFSKNNVNLTKLESRPIPDNPWEYVFYADLDSGIDDKNAKIALGELEATTTFIKVLGSYPKGKKE